MRSILLNLWLLLILPSFLLANDKWTAERITATECQNESNTWINFINIFELKEIPQEVFASIACDSKYWMWINGELSVFEGQLKRGPTPLDTYYDEVDITPFLKAGANKIAILVWYFGKDGFSHNSSGQAGLVFQCDQIGVKSDDTWLSRIDKGFEHTNSPYPNFRLPESNIRFDAGKGSFDWIKSETGSAGFTEAKVIGKAESLPWNKLIKRPIPLWKDYGIKEYVNSRVFPFTSSGDTIICKLPYNAHVTPFFKIESEAGKEIEILTDHYYGGRPPNVRAEYVTSSGVQEYETPGWMNGHQVKYFFPKGIKILELKYRETGYDTDFTGSFKCNDPFYNLLWSKALRTLYVTMRDTYMDCPDRERAQWWGDVVNESGEAFYALSPSSALLTEKGMMELINWQRDDGTLFSPIPGIWDSELPGQMLASIGYYGFWNYYWNTGDKKLIERVYDGVKKYLQVWNLDETGILTHREGDWYWGDWGINIDKQCLYNEWYFLALKAYRNMSELLGYPEEVNKVEKDMKAFKTAFNKHLWNGSEYRSSGYKTDTDDRSQALAVVAGLADTEKYPQIYKLLQTQKYASPYMEKYVIEALFLMGYSEYGLTRLKERFSEMVNDPDKTTLYEGWGDANKDFGRGSDNHAWSGGGLTILSQYVCGVYPAEAGWRTINVKPNLGNLSFASTGNLTVAGEFFVEVSKKQRQFLIDVTIPEGSKGIIFIPVSYKKIILNEQLIWNKKAIRNVHASFMNIEDGFCRFEIQAGKWKFNAN